MEILDLTTLGSGTFFPRGITTNGTNLFWTDTNQDALYTANLDGSSAIEILDVTTLGSGFFSPQYITITPTSQPQPVPEPNSILGLITLGGLALAKSRKDALK